MEKKQITPESLVLSACVRWLLLNGCFVWRNNTGAVKAVYTRKDGSRGTSHIRYGYPGSADIIGVNKNGRFISIECKSSVGKLSPHQEQFGQVVSEHGGVYVVARSVDDLEASRGIILGAYSGKIHNIERA